MIDAERLRLCNALLVVIGCHGRRFFHHEGRFSYFEPSPSGRWLHFVECWNGERLFASRRRGLSRPWRTSVGGTLQDMLRDMSLYIRGHATGELVARHFGPAPAWYSNGDPWGYGEHMSLVRTTARAFLGLPIATKQAT